MINKVNIGTMMNRIESILPEEGIVKGKYGDPLAIIELNYDDKLLIINPASLYFESVILELRDLTGIDVEYYITKLIDDLSKMSLDIDYADSDLLNDVDFLNTEFISLEGLVIDAVTSLATELKKGFITFRCLI